MKILLDTNVIVGLSEKDRYPIVAEAIKKICRDGHDMFVVPQVIYEFWVVATRPAHKNGLGFPTEIAEQVVVDMLKIFKFLDDTAKIYGKWFDIVKDNKVSGKQAHDARLAAAVAVHGLDAILTQNGRDLKRYAGLKVIDPQHAVAAGP